MTTTDERRQSGVDAFAVDPSATKQLCEKHESQAPLSLGTRIGRKVPNILTFSRVFIVPVFIVLLVDPTPQKNFYAAVLFALASVTDWLDGYIARLYKAESILGKLLDPLADKVLVTAALVMLAAVPSGHRVDAWIVVVLLSRELIVTGLRSLAAVQGMVVAASDWAKHKTAWTLIAIIFLLLDARFEFLGFTIDSHLSGTVFLWIALVLSVGTGLHYAISLRKLFI